ncbi:TetR family transcriptional regulator [Nonomuraea sp. NPDC052129]|uniref:TetR family transcriptional regulator n=1 Tax=Nonomuraea sp. NPDC052129 TaxID=3154651 RepID=UPI003426D66B
MGSRPAWRAIPWSASRWRSSAPAQRQTLSPQRIATTAVEIADAEGLEAITMRRLATELGVAPMAPYRHVSGKDDLLELMVDHVYAGDLAPQMIWHMRTGRYPTFQRYLQTATRKDDTQWQFETGLTYVLNGIATTLAI